MDFNNLDTILREKINRAFSDKTKQIGDFNFSDEEQARLKELYWFLKGKTKWSVDDAIIALFFLICSIKNYKGEWTGKEFWNRIEPQIGWKPDYNIGLPKIGEVLSKMANRPSFKSKTGINKYVESLFYQAYSPQTSVKSFIKLAWSLYSNPDVFDFTYFDTDADANLCLAIIESLNKHYKDIDFDSDFTFESVTYSIRAGLRYAFEQDKVGATLILRRILKYIDYIYQHKENVDDEEEGYLGFLCNESVPKIIASFSENNSIIKTPRSRETVDDINKIKGSYILKDDILYLYFPKIRLYRDNQQYKTATLTIYYSLGNDRLKIVETKFDCVGEDYKHILREIYFPIQQYLDMFGDEINLSATLSFDENAPVFDSKKSLFRKFIIFKEESESKSSLLAPNDYRVVCPSNFEIKTNVHTNEQPTIKNKHIFDISFNDGDRISFNGTYVFFGQKEAGANFFFEEDNTLEIPGIYFKGNSSESYSVYKKIGDFIIRTDNNVRPETLDIQIYTDDGVLINRYPLSKLDSEKGFYSISLDNDINEAKKLNKYLLIVTIKDQHTEKFYFNKHFVILPDISIEYGDSPYSSDKSSTLVTFFGKKYEIENRNSSLSEEFLTDIGLAEIQTPYFCWRINQNGKKWRPINNNQPLLLDEFQSNDVISIDSIYKNIRIYCGNHRIQESSKKGVFLFGQFKNSLYGHEAFINDEDVYALVNTDGSDADIRFELFSTHNNPYIFSDDSNELYIFENNRLIIDISKYYHGYKNDKLKFTLIKQNSDKPIEAIGNSDSKMIIENVPDNLYSLSISCHTSFDRGENYWTQIWSDDIELGDLNGIRFSDSDRLYITKISKCKIRNLYLSNIKYVGDEGFGPKFSAKIHSDWFKPEYCEFIIDEGINLHSTNVHIISIYYLNNKELKEYSFDTKSNSLTKQNIDGERYRECLSIYSRIQ